MIIDTFIIFQVEQTLTDFSEKTSQNLQTALAVTAKNATALQRVAKKSVDQVTFDQDLRSLSEAQ